MTEVFKKYIEDKVPLSQLDWGKILGVTKIKKLRKQQYLLQEGEIWRYHAFVCEGCLKRYRVDERGVEHIIQFSVENWWAGDRESLMNNVPSKYNIDAVEDSSVLLINDQDFEMLCREIPNFGSMVNNILSRSLNAAQDRINAAISFSAEEKYLDFMHKYAGLANRLPRHMLAAYLGMSPETLSRIRNSILKK
jgi:CRP/FNR family transcriptional regulator